MKNRLIQHKSFNKYKVGMHIDQSILIVVSLTINQTAHSAQGVANETIKFKLFFWFFDSPTLILQFLGNHMEIQPKKYI